MKFSKQKLDAMGVIRVEYTDEHSITDPPTSTFRIVATREGVRLEGESSVISDRKELDVFAKAVADAWQDHRALVPKIMTSASGH